ncbi:hypothetical protein N3K66_005928 [Trichothecium roseum]|uniref:Uncharacterized protein n=1 Tax=Trichothecium roseum TaxID=47278 RepID=A0ACC0UZ85_9HYPO|nr:hypothetical protein N3K66_005928 [Trichothecium roseum]
MAHSQPIPNDSRPSSPPIDARFRRTQASSSSGDCSEGDEEGARPFSISRVKYRVGAPALRLLPMESFYHVNPLHKVMDDDDAARRLTLQIEEDARRILTERQIIDPPVEGEEDVDFRVKLIERAMSEIPRSAEPTLMIEAPWLADDYPDIESCIEDFCLFHLGYDLRNNDNNPITVYIAVSYDSNELHWPPALATVEKLLAEAGWGHIQVHMEHGEPATHLGLWA